jgi:alpha-D-xyloside xylohydrolase
MTAGRRLRIATSQTLTFGQRKGSFPGMLTKRMFDVVFVNENDSAGVGVNERADQIVRYSGQTVSVMLAKGKQAG